MMAEIFKYYFYQTLSMYDSMRMVQPLSQYRQHRRFKSDKEGDDENYLSGQDFSLFVCLVNIGKVSHS